MEPALPEKIDCTQEIDDDSLIRQIQDDPLLFAALYRRYAPRVYRYLYGRVGNRTDAEDLTAQVFLEVLQALPHYHSQGTFPAWLFTLVRRRIIDWQRKSRDTISIEWIENQVAPDLDLLGEVIRSEDLHRLDELFAQLTDEHQELIRLRFAAGLTYAQIGKVLGRSEAAVGMALTRLLQRLHQAMGGLRWLVHRPYKN